MGINGIMMINTGMGSGRPHLNYLDVIQAKRQEAADKQKAGKQDRLLVNISRENATKIAGELARQSARTRVTTQKVEVSNPVTSVKTPDMQEVVKRVEDLTKVVREQKPDDTNLIKAVGELNKALNELPKKIVIPEPEKITSVAVSNLHDWTPQLEEIRDAVGSIEVTPVVNVAAPKVPEISTLGIEKTIAKLEDVFKQEPPKDEKLDLSQFKAQDLDNDSPSVEYVGLVAPDGCWQIIEYSTETNTLRYKFGRGNYALAWERRVEHAYKTLDEATHELTA